MSWAHEDGWVLAFDPGLRTAGVALGFGRRVVAAGLLENSVERDTGCLAWQGMLTALERWLFEHIECVTPDLVLAETFHHRVGEKVPMNTMLDLQGVSAMVLGTLQAKGALAIGMIPASWKGTLNADAMTARIESRLRERGEWSLFEPIRPAGKRHNAVDAAGMLLHRYGALAARKVYPRE